MEPADAPRDRSWRIAAIALALFTVALVLVAILFWFDLVVGQCVDCE